MIIGSKSTGEMIFEIVNCSFEGRFLLSLSKIVLSKCEKNTILLKTSNPCSLIFDLRSAFENVIQRKFKLNFVPRSRFGSFDEKEGNGGGGLE